MSLDPQQLKELEAQFPGGFTIRDEANALTTHCFRNGPLEDLHAGEDSELLLDPSLSRITQEEMKSLMIAASSRLAQMLELRDSDPERYRTLVMGNAWIYCGNGER